MHLFNKKNINILNEYEKKKLLIFEEKKMEKTGAINNVVTKMISANEFECIAFTNDEINSLSFSLLLGSTFNINHAILLLLCKIRYLS